MKIKLSKPKGKTKKMAKGEWRYQVILILTLIIMMYPIVYMIGTSFKTLQDIFSSGLNVFTSNPTMANYIQVFKSNDILILLKNSLIIALIVTVSKIVTSVLASYCLCFMDLKHPEVIFGLFTISMFIRTMMRKDEYGRGFIQYMKKYSLSYQQEKKRTPFQEFPPL